MQNQIVKGLTMLMLIAGVALMAALVSAHAQSSTVVADVPFEFTVGGKSLKAGEYSVKAFTTSSAALLVRNEDSNDSAIRMTNTIEARVAPKQGKLIFHRYGQRYFLSEVWTRGERQGKQLQKCDEERAIERQLAANPSKSELARSTYETVEIVAMVR